MKSTENYERRFVMTFPNETLPKGRCQKTTTLYDQLLARGAWMGQGIGLENALWFADGPEDAHEDPTFKRSRSHDHVAREVKAIREAGPKRRLVTLTIDVDGIDVSNDEAILKDGAAVGYVSSGGYAHHVGRSMAMGYVNAEHAEPETRLQVEILGGFFDAEVQGAPLYDANGANMRG